MGFFGDVVKFIKAAGQPIAPTATTTRTQPRAPTLSKGTSASWSPGVSTTYLGEEAAKRLLIPSEDGMPPLHFSSHNGALWLTEDSTGLLVNVGARPLPKLGIWSVKVRGTDYYKKNVWASEMRPGMPAELVREPNNEHDSNAVAIAVGGAIVGYFNKQMASRMAKIIDSGTPLSGMFLAGAGVRKSWDGPIKVIAADAAIIAHLKRKGSDG